MHRDSRHFAGNIPPTQPYEVGGHNYNVPLGGHDIHGVPAAPALDAAPAGRKYGIPDPLNAFVIQPSETCPKNFIIFDQTDNTNRVMFHPAQAHKFGSSNFHMCATHVEEYGKSMGRNTDIKEKISSFKKDTEDLNALRCSEEENDEDDDLVSTGRTPDNKLGDNYPDSSCLMEGPGSCILGSTCKSTSNNVVSSDWKRDRMKKMFDALRGVMSGGDQLDMAAVLDEAVRYLKSLKEEVEKLGILNSDD